MRTTYVPLFYFELVRECYDGEWWLVEYVVFYTGDRQIINATAIGDENGVK